MNKCRNCNNTLNESNDLTRFCSRGCFCDYRAKKEFSKPIALGDNLYNLIPDDKKSLIEKVYPYPWLKRGLVY